mmetsp:Transcript_32071/g.75621  ORF Transcript_32071/g.75621 Transcript_32071/m.75621 type:complete len:287 (+) Transcript_32071:761-1621(+)|eukprot:2965307-Rhodomonas_salina.1
MGKAGSARQACFKTLTLRDRSVRLADAKVVVKARARGGALGITPCCRADEGRARDVAVAVGVAPVWAPLALAESIAASRQRSSLDGLQLQIHLLLACFEGLDERHLSCVVPIRTLRELCCRRACVIQRVGRHKVLDSFPVCTQLCEEGGRQEARELFDVAEVCCRVAFHSKQRTKQPVRLSAATTGSEDRPVDLAIGTGACAQPSAIPRQDVVVVVLHNAPVRAASRRRKVPVVQVVERRVHVHGHCVGCEGFQPLVGVHCAREGGARFAILSVDVRVQKLGHGRL